MMMYVCMYDVSIAPSSSLWSGRVRRAALSRQRGTTPAPAEWRRGNCGSASAGAAVPQRERGARCHHRVDVAIDNREKDFEPSPPLNLPEVSLTPESYPTPQTPASSFLHAPSPLYLRPNNRTGIYKPLHPSQKNNHLYKKSMTFNTLPPPTTKNTPPLPSG